MVSGTLTDTVFIISSDTFGRGSEDLGRQLMAKFVLQLSTQSPKPHAIAFYNAGVKLLAEGPPCVAVGHVTDMRDILATVHAAPKVVTV